MKTLLKLLPLLLLLGCGSGDPASLKEQIDKKKAAISKLESEIAELEKQLNLSADSSGQASDAQLVGVKEVKKEVFNHFIEVQGTIDGDNNIAVFPEAMGVIDQLYVKVGQKVARGQRLAKMNNSAIAEQIRGLKTSLELATTVYNKQKSLWDQNIGSEVQYLQAKNSKETLESQLASAEQQMDMMVVKSPIDGTIEEMSIKLGQTASPQMPAFRVVNFGKLKVVAEVAEAYASKIKPGDNLEVYLPDIQKTYQATVSFASNYISPINRTFRVEAFLSESSPGMKANLVAVIKINDYQNDSAVVLPVNYIQHDKNGTFVFVADNSGSQPRAVKRMVTTGQVYNGLAEVLSGLENGDQVITLGYLDIEDGENIRL